MGAAQQSRARDRRPLAVWDEPERQRLGGGPRRVALGPLEVASISIVKQKSRPSMRHSDQNGFRVLKRCRFLFSLLLVLLSVCNTAAGIRRVEISHHIEPSSIAASTYFLSHGRYGGGIVPRGVAEFLSPTQVRLSARQLKLVILDKAKLRNDQPDYDSIGIQWNDDVYELSAQDDLIYPLMKFVQRGSYIAYTIPDEIDAAYFRKNALVPTLVGYVAKEFNSAPHAGFLYNVDLWTETEEVPLELKDMIMKDVNKSKGDGQLRNPGTYVNADFHVKYQVFLNNANGKRVADVGGLPLRYVWDVARNGSTIVSDVEVFTFPEKEFDLQYRAVLFFQTAAILRQFSEDNKQEFDRFLKEVGEVMGEHYSGFHVSASWGAVLLAALFALSWRARRLHSGKKVAFK